MKEPHQLGASAPEGKVAGEPVDLLLQAINLRLLPLAILIKQELRLFLFDLLGFVPFNFFAPLFPELLEPGPGLAV
jgi:hypothetical protein